MYCNSATRTSKNLHTLRFSKVMFLSLNHQLQCKNIGYSTSLCSTEIKNSRALQQQLCSALQGLEVVKYIQNREDNDTTCR